MAINGILRAEFVYAEEARRHPLTQAHVVQRAVLDGGITAAATALAIEAGVSLAAKAAESLIDAVAARAQPEVTTLDAMVPLDGLYQGGGLLAVADGFLVLHNGTGRNADGHSMLLVLRVESSPDRSAMRFTVAAWTFMRFLEVRPWRLLQNQDSRDFALKVELLTPSAAGLGSRAVYFEQMFSAMDLEEMRVAFEPGQKLAWLALPAPPKPAVGGAVADDRLSMPLNLRVTVIETTRPNLLAEWLQSLIKDKKSDVLTLVRSAVRQGLDPAAEAADASRRADGAGTGYGAYRKAWDEVAKLLAARPAEPGPTATADERAKATAEAATWRSGLLVRQQSVQALQLAARAAFDAAGLPWPGDLPPLGA